MAWTTPKTWSVGEVVTAANVNLHLRDNLTFLYGTTYEKTTEKDVVNTVTKTDLLNSEITVPANAMSSTGYIRFNAWGDYLNNSGGTRTIRLELKLGASVLWDSGASDTIAADANRAAWHLTCIIQALASTSSQRGGGQFMLGTPSATPVTGSGPITSASFRGFAPFLTATTSVDTTSAQALTFSVTHSTNNASLSMRLEGARVEIR